MKKLSESKAYGGIQGVYSHWSEATNCEMTFGLFMPEEAEYNSVPVLWYLSGLTCTHDNAMTKSGAQNWAAEQGIALVFPDTSPRGESIADNDDFDLGQGAGFYVNATQNPWAKHFNMWDYITISLPDLLFNNFSLDKDRQSITGHSMGGHGALICALRNPGRYASVSAFAPIAHPTICPWGEKAFKGYLGDNTDSWKEWDATLLIPEAGERLPLLIDQGTADGFLESQLNPEALMEACEQHSHPINLRMRNGYDHSYFFIASFIDDHLNHHAKALGLS